MTEAVGKTRWRRFFLVLAPCYVVLGAMVWMIASGALAVSFVISGIAADITVDSIATGAKDSNGVGFYQFAVTDFNNAGAGTPQIEAVIPDGTLTNLCQSVGPGPALRITAGGSGTPVHASNLVVDADLITAGSATFTNIKIGQDLGAFATPPQVPAARGTGPNVTTVAAPPGTFAQVADAATLTTVRQHSFGTQASSFTFPGLTVTFGAKC